MYGVAFGVFLPLTTLVKTEKSMGKVVNMGLATTFLFAFVSPGALRPTVEQFDQEAGRDENVGSERIRRRVTDHDFQLCRARARFPSAKKLGRKVIDAAVARIAMLEAMCNLWLFYVITGGLGT